MANHGVVTYADDLLRAYMKMETVEHFAKIALVTHVLGRQQPLSDEDMGKLLIVREKYEGNHHTAEDEDEPAAEPEAPIGRRRR
jgi:L-fuculose-phosphate aldolase